MTTGSLDSNTNEPPALSDGLETETADTDDSEVMSVSEHVAVARDMLIDRYVVVHEIGAGGVGVVLKAYDPVLNRHVALKLLRVGRSSTHELLLREGRAIAQLNHPNVVSVYDIGRFRDELFIAMELIQGTSLREWIGKEPRPWQQAVAVFVQAGRGLAAAHEVGIIHRDFKPANAMFGDDGRVRVLDFGLARIFQSVDANATAHLDSDVSSNTITRTGGIAGTPAYMSPEQHEGRTPDVRSDVFSFCVSLYEAIAGQRPFAGPTIRALRANVFDGNVLPFPDNVDVPPWLRTLLERGLATSPNDRFASMQELLAELEADRKRSFVAPSLAVAAVVGAAIALLAIGSRDTSQPAELCKVGDQRVASVWNAQARSALAAGFQATKLSFATEVSTTVVARLDKYTARWADAHDQTCEATHVTGEQSDSMMDRRMWCLDSRLQAVSAVIHLLSAKVDRNLVVKSIALIGQLPRVQECNDPQHLTDVPPPKPSERDAAFKLLQRLANVHAQYLVGQTKQTIPLFEQIHKDAVSLEYLPVRARIAFRLAEAYESQGNNTAAQKTFRSAANMAASAKLDPLVANATMRQAQSALKQRPKLANELLAAAETSIKRAGSPPILVIKLRSVRASLLSRRANYSEALAEHRHIAKLLAKHSNSGRESVNNRLAIATDLILVGKYDEALHEHTKLLPLVEQVMGKRHPSMATLLRKMSLLHQRRGRPKQARALAQRALAIYRDAFGEDHIQTTKIIEVLATMSTRAGDYGTAVTLLRKVEATRIRTLGADHHLVADVKANLATALGYMGKHDEAAKLLHDALAIIEQREGTNHPRYADLLNNLAALLGEMKRYDEAATMFEKTIAIIEKRLGSDHVDLVFPLQGLARMLLTLGQAAKVVAVAERGIKLARKGNPANYHALRWYLGRALWSLGRDRKRAHAMIADAGVKLVAIGGGVEPMGKFYLKWAKANPPPK